MAEGLRPYLTWSTDEMAAHAWAWRDDPSELRLALHELSFRKTQSARQLERKLLAMKTEQTSARAASAKVEDAATNKTRQFMTATLEKLREKLIDISKRNPLIAFKHSERGATFVRVVDELPKMLFDRLSSGTMGFEPLPNPEEEPADQKTPRFKLALETARLTDQAYLNAMANLGEGAKDEETVERLEAELVARVRESLGLPKLSGGKKVDIDAFARANGFNPSFELPKDGEGGAHLSDSAIRVLYTRDRLDARLRTIYDRYRSHAAELGIHTLQLIFGFVEWREADGDKVAHHAPLLLMPVNMAREIKASRYLYQLEGQDETPSVNMALQELLRRNYGVVLPAIADDEGPEDYFARVQAIFDAAKKGLRVLRYVTLAVVPFPNMAVWQDLSAAQWPGEQILEHAQLQKLLGATGGASGSSAFPSDYDVEDLAVGSVPPLVLPADVSQHSAMVDVCSGKSLAVEGPPGTGKSQTIANMIAACIDRGQRVLFVAEKRAALEVVARRLEALGFGPLMLELHSERSTKSQIIESLRQRLKASGRRPAHTLDQTRKDLAQRRDLLKLYRALLRQPAGTLNQPVNALIWREMSLRHALEPVSPRALWTREVAAAGEIDALDLRRRREALDAVETTAKAILEAFGDFARSRWHAVGQVPVQPIGQDTIGQQLTNLVGQLSALEVCCDSLAKLCQDEGPSNLSALTLWANATAGLPLPESLEEARLAAALAGSEQVRNLAEGLDRWQSLRSQAALLHPVPAEAPIDLIAEAEARFAQADVTGATLRGAQAALAQAQTQREQLRRLAAFSRQTFVRLAPGAQQDADGLTAIIEALSALDSLDDLSLALRSPAALEDTAPSRLGEAMRTAAQLLTQEERVASFGDIARLMSVMPEELEATAAVLINTPPVLRLFSGAYRAAIAKGRTLAAQPAAKPAEIAQGLRDAAAFKRASEAFRADVRIATLFPTSSWSGHRSDFAQAHRLFELVGAVAQRLTNAGLAAALEPLMAEPMRSLRFTAEQARRLEADLTGFREMGVSDDLDGAASRLDGRIKALEQAISAAQSAGLGPDTAVGPASALSEVLAQFQSLAAELKAAQAEHSWFRGTEDEPADLTRYADYADVLSECDIPEPLGLALSEADAPVTLITDLLQAGSDALGAADQFNSAWTEFCEAYAVNEEAFCGAPPETAPLAVHKQALTEALQDEVGVRLFADLGRYRRVADDLGVSDLVEAAQNLGSLEHLADVFELSMIRTLLQKVFRTDGMMFERLGGAQLTEASARFVDLDRTLAELEAARIIADRLNDYVPAGNGSGARTTWTDLCLIDNECSKIKRHIPIRDLVKRSHEALQALKPVWLMSPTSVAQFVPPGAAEFDLILIDEASQMTPEMAVGALARGRQVVVVGDPKQLPPSNFFKNRSEAVEDDEEDDGLDIETESILDLAFARLDHRRRLKWHYRSQHAKLIQFSNRQFYESELVVFPSPITSDDFLGVKSEFVGGAYEARVNVKEAEAVIEALVGLIYARPELTFGVVTMNTQQRELIFQEFERIKSQNKVVADYALAREGTVDELFIKNLENVQGDERDIILVSTLYGPPPGGGRVLQRFGLFTRKDGHRRLNVLVTRARMATLLYTSLRPTDVVVTETSSRGVRSFKEYLAYAEGAPTADDAGGGVPDSDFEEFVAERIRAHGYQVMPQVGVEGFRIDLGVTHPSFPAGFLAGVECDGATYHSALCVRDRDRIRQEVLERLGWRIYRVWSTDWFNDPERETAKLIAWLERLREKAEASFASRQAAARSKPAPVAVKIAAPEDTVAAKSPAPHAAPSSASPTAPAPPDAAMEGATADLFAQLAVPSGKRHVVDGIEFYEEMPGYFEVWLDGAACGSVERLSTAMRAANVYDSNFKVDKPSFRVTRYWDETSFNSDDIYAAVRKLASNYRERLVEA